MKSLIETEDCRRTKTNPDQNSLISYSSNKSCASSERKTQVKVACKVLCEMREDESSKLAMKFTQLRIVLATQSLLHLLQKYKSAKLQTYFWILQQERKTNQHDLKISLPPVIDDLSNNQIREQIHQEQYQQIPNVTAIILYHILNKILIQQQKSTFKRIKEQKNIYKAITQITNLIKQCQIRFQYIGLLNIIKCNKNTKIQKTSILDQNNEIQSEDEIQESIIQNNEEMSIKEQLAIKFASITIIASIMNEKIQKQQFVLFFNILRSHSFKKQLNLSYTNEITQIFEQQSYIDQNSILIGSRHLCSIFNVRLKEYLQEIKTYNLNTELQIGDSLNNLQVNKHSEQSLNNSYDDLYTQRMLPSQSRNEEEEEKDNQILIFENSNNDYKAPCSLQNITDIEDSTKLGELNNQQTQPKVKNKHQDIIKNAVKSYCNLQQRKPNLQEAPRILQKEESKDEEIKQIKEQDTKLYIFTIIGISMIALIFFILQ